MIFKAGDAASDLNGFVDRGSQIEGELRFENTFRVDGRVSGSVSSEGDLVVGEGGEVDGEIRVGRLFVSGTVKGSVEALRRVQISPGGRVFADLDTPSLAIEDGAIFQGACSMTRSSRGEGKPASEREERNDQGPKILPHRGPKSVR